MAQLVARLNGIQKVRGSNPLSSTTRKGTVYRVPFLVVKGEASRSLVIAGREGDGRNGMPQDHREKYENRYRGKTDAAHDGSACPPLGSLRHGDA